MTSKHLFFKAMREDLRHKIWMIALSSLGSFLALPVAWLMYISNSPMYSSEYWQIPQGEFLSVISFIFRDFLMISGGFIAIAGAVIVGLFGFRYVFHKKMVDTYHSIPIKRSTLYAACWLNGLLIWLFPFLVCLLITLGLVLAFLAGTPGVQWIPEMLSEIGINVLLLTVAFLLVYHLVLTAVMISGNILNTLVSMLILGFGVISVYVMGIGFFSVYMDTFYAGVLNFEPAIYASPLLSSGYLLYRMKEQSNFGQMGPALPLIINICVMVFLGILAFLLYKKRASEMAEQGIRNKTFSAVLKTVAGFAAGMGGWMLFYYIVDFPGWGIFGALLAEILVFGILDMIFNMEFKAFFAHKIHMAATAVVCLAVCISFYADWLGYDAYLPDKEDIAEIAVYNGDFANRSLYPYGTSTPYMLNNIHFQDVDAAYAYLERMTDKEKRNSDASIYMNSYSLEGDDRFYEIDRIRILYTRITLKNGRTYYRVYKASTRDYDVVRPILTAQEYLEKNYIIDRQLAASYDTIRLIRAGHNAYMELPSEEIQAIAEAYNRDILENPETTLLKEGILLTRLEFDRSYGFTYKRNTDGPRPYSLWIEVYDFMEHTIAALENAGYGEWAALQDPDEVSEIRLYSYIWLRDIMDYGSVQDMVNSVRDQYGLYRVEDFDEGESAEAYDSVGTVEAYPVSGEMSVPVQTEPFSDERIYLSITDREEIRELMQYVNYVNPRSWNSLFQKDTVDIEVYVGEDDVNVCDYYIMKGDLPEKYIQRFEQLFLSLRQN